VTETASALSLKQRSGSLDEISRLRSDQVLARLVSTTITMLALPAASFARAAQLAGEWRLGLRAGDALHLAVADHHRATIYTRDRAQAEAARHVGVKARLLFDA
jgi:predicted nucleic acid-binding protein